MIFSTKQSGFTLIEVLISMILVSVFLLGFEKACLYSLKLSQQTLFQFIAIERLASLSSMISINPREYTSYILNWNKVNSTFLPNCYSEIKTNSHRLLARLFWRSSLSTVWSCNTKPLKQMACEEKIIII